MENTKHILLVDDVERNIYALKNYLESNGYKVSTTSNGEEAMRFLEHTRPDLILLDMMMPVVDGYETLKTLHTNANFNTIPVIAVTARAMKGDREKCLEAGAWDYISKPIDLELLKQILNRWLNDEHK